MLVRYSTVIAMMATAAMSAPLNINLGAYSPALVVGDGEISFAGQQGAEGIVNTLEGAAAANNAAVAQGQAIAPAGKVRDLAESSALNEPASRALPGSMKELDPREEEEEEQEEAAVVKRQEEGGLTKRQAAGFDRALQFAEAALTKGPKIQLGTEAAGVGILVDNNPTPASAVTAA
ncbi:hypothetical protein M406DRAFT_327934 [Cryphonectria parasitica EP155]|uniref:Uncharacterized protein n=1 Tax=Cryphonectria parasitica (strain ATCC 38755 / EP155) TaxID=660469 RepID=A0A9P5CR76_CRYP1|nr:uncharacterized protein M406DRAFT_327934 [Cryphonectria parasitica EP155]KAF3766820.1 hypothetical protein M406DRAFT_327934 [Cryphonectria parasitica EP155]